MARNKQAEILATSFMAYIISHPEERFWQALKNWSGHDYIYVGTEVDPPTDTFYFKGLDK